MFFPIVILLVVAHAMTWIVLCNAADPITYDGPKDTALEGCKLVEIECDRVSNEFELQEYELDYIFRQYESCVKVVCPST